jgi:hypothetical protein
MVFFLFAFGQTLREFLPQISRRVGSPGFDQLQIQIGMKQKSALKNQISRGKGIRVTDGPKADIFSRPRTETFRAEQRLA